mmetsp:Transcript_14246/g.39270  ORF Transcript_14246/g.39270 Transcript_14246/m.39270 type:complete len:325 (-) Transcript_14246:2433-3407(-)
MSWNVAAKSSPFDLFNSTTRRCTRLNMAPSSAAWAPLSPATCSVLGGEGDVPLPFCSGTDEGSAANSACLGQSSGVDVMRSGKSDGTSAAEASAWRLSSTFSCSQHASGRFSGARCLSNNSSAAQKCGRQVRARRPDTASSTTSGKVGNVKSASGAGPSGSPGVFASALASSCKRRAERTVTPMSVPCSCLKQKSMQSEDWIRPSPTRAPRNAATTSGSVKARHWQIANSSIASCGNHRVTLSSASTPQSSGRTSGGSRGAARNSISTTTPVSPALAVPSHAAKVRNAECHSDRSHPASKALRPAATALTAPTSGFASTSRHNR